MKTGSLDLPLHNGSCPSWLFEDMKKLSKQISRVIIEEYGTEELLKRLSHPPFFQSLGCVLGFDWHSSGLTTTVCAALKTSLNDLGYGIRVAGGKGKASTNTVNELKSEDLKQVSRLTAKVDNSCIQDDYNLYHHCLFFDDDNWCVVQQGMNDNDDYARRYHWFNNKDFVSDPGQKIIGSENNDILNLVSGKSEETRKCSVDLVKDDPNHLRRYFTGQTTLSSFNTEPTSKIINSDYFESRMPQRHQVLDMDLTDKDWEMLNKAYEYQPENYKELVSLTGLGRKKLRALALIANIIHGTKADWNDPVKYSYSHGGKDGTPYPVDNKAYNSSIKFLKNVVKEAKGYSALRKLNDVITDKNSL